MSATVGDRIRMHSNSVDAPDRTGTIVAVLGDDDGPPYRVRFDSGEETIVSPGPDAVVEQASAGQRVEVIAGQVGERAEEAAAKAGEKATEAADVAKEKAADATGSAARKVADVADHIAKRFKS